RRCGNRHAPGPVTGSPADTRAPLSSRPPEVMMTTTEPGTRRLPLNFFGIAFGTAGLAGTWTASGQLLGAPTAVGETLWAAAALAWGIITVVYLRRSGGLRAVAGDLRHPVLGPFASLVPAVGSLLAAHLFQWYPVA